MNSTLWALFLAITSIIVVYHHCGFGEIRRVYLLWFNRDYWTSYNIVEAVSWACKAIVIVPGLVFGLNIWWLYFGTLISSLALIWASNKKLLPTLVAFNTLWVWMSLMVLCEHLIG